MTLNKENISAYALTVIGAVVLIHVWTEDIYTCISHWVNN